MTPYRVGLDLGITENFADRLLREVASKLPRMEMLKMKIISQARRANCYFAPNCFNQQDLIKVAEPKDEFNKLLALSAYTQSALGLFMQKFITDLTPRCKGTILTVFDSALIEYNPKNQERLLKYLKTAISPFRAGEFKTADNFYDAQN